MNLGIGDGRFTVARLIREVSPQSVLTHQQQMRPAREFHGAPEGINTRFTTVFLNLDNDSETIVRALIPEDWVS